VDHSGTVKEKALTVLALGAGASPEAVAADGGCASGLSVAKLVDQHVDFQFVPAGDGIDVD